MMRGVQKLLRELHSRTIWQVWILYGGLSWGVLESVDLLVGLLGLPDWTLGVALVLLLAGLPIVTATAYAQRGIPRLRRDPHEGIRPEDVQGLTPDQVHRDPEAHPLHGTPVFTWRNMLVGGVGAGALLVASVAAYLVLWAAGIGPMGSLVAQGVLERRDPVILADFGGVEGIAGAVTEAFRVDLLESQVVTLVDGRAVSDALVRMGRDGGEAITSQLAREIAVREGLKAVLEGEVSSVGSGHLLVVRIVVPEDGRVLVGFRESAEDDSDLIPAIDRLSLRVREKLGESLRSIRTGEPLAAVTTTSLDALRTYSRALAVEARGDVVAAIGLLEEAIALDSTFAMAHRKLAVLLSNTGGDGSRARSAAEAAYRHRARLTQRERYLAEASYHEQVTGDSESAVQAYRRVLDRHPHDPVASNNLSILLLARDDPAGAAGLLERAVTGPGRTRSAHANLFFTYSQLGRFAAARGVLERMAASYPPDGMLPVLRAALSWAEADPVRTETELREGLDLLRPESAPAALELRLQLGRTLAAQGLIGDALSELERGMRISERAEAYPLARAFAGEIAVTRATMEGDRRRVVAEAETTLRRFAAVSPPDPGDATLAMLWARVGEDPDRAEAAWAGAGDGAAEPETRARVRLLRGDPEGALAELNALRREESDCETCAAPLMARAYESLRMPDSAAAELERFLEDRTVSRFLDGAQDLPGVLERLASLHERLGRPGDAAATWTRFAELWARADAPLQPRVTRARAEAQRLSGEPGA